MEKIKNILLKNNMCTRPEYYSGRGATTTDLTDKILFSIHADIKKEFGEEAAKAFVQMVANMKIMSATAFIEELYALYCSDWKLEKPIGASGIAVPKKENGEYDVEMGMFGMVEAMFSSDRDQSNEIRDHFLLRNGIKPASVKGNRYRDPLGYERIIGW